MIETGLIEECRNGDLSNFRKVVEITAPFAYSVAFRMLGDEDKSRDIVQETMITIWQKLKKIKTAESYKTWVYRIILNKCYDELRRSKRSPEHVIDGKAWELISERISSEAGGDIDNEENAMIMNSITSQLSPRQKAVFILSDIEGISNDEISEITGMAKTVVKSNLYHARKKVQSLVQKYL